MKKRADVILTLVLIGAVALIVLLTFWACASEIPRMGAYLPSPPEQETITPAQGAVQGAAAVVQKISNPKAGAWTWIFGLGIVAGLAGVGIGIYMKSPNMVIAGLGVGGGSLGLLYYGWLIALAVALACVAGIGVVLAIQLRRILPKVKKR